MKAALTTRRQHQANACSGVTSHTLPFHRSLQVVEYSLIAMSFPSRSNTFPQRTNSTNPRPGSSAFPRAPKGADPPPLRMPPRRASTAGGQGPKSNMSSPRPRPTPKSSPNSDSATKTQVNQTFAISMMINPANPLPFPLPIPLGLVMLLGPSEKGSGLPPRR